MGTAVMNWQQKIARAEIILTQAGGVNNFFCATLSLFPIFDGHTMVQALISNIVFFQIPTSQHN